MEINPIHFKDDKLIILDQTKLPLEIDFIITDDVERIAVSIERLEVRGAPLIGITAAYAAALSLKSISSNTKQSFYDAFERLRKTRPTAVNLFWALNEMKKFFEENSEKSNIYELMLKKAIEIHIDDETRCTKMALNGLSIFQNKSIVLTHCNTGKLVAGGNGTALGVIIEAHKNNLIENVFIDETRPLLQGSRLTAYELENNNIPFSIITDSSAAHVIKNKKVDLVITGADRIAANGDSANKIGTYNLAILCQYHKIPFYIAAPFSTIDAYCKTGDDIVIEERNKDEILKIKNNYITKSNYSVYAPAFDVTPSILISGIITEVKVFTYPYNFNV